jgi:hypothetical protein
MAEFELSTEDSATLGEVLGSVLSDLRYEINNTDAHAYREKLRAKQAVLERVLGKLNDG